MNASLEYVSHREECCRYESQGSGDLICPWPVRGKLPCGFTTILLRGVSGRLVDLTKFLPRGLAVAARHEMFDTFVAGQPQTTLRLLHWHYDPGLPLIR